MGTDAVEVLRDRKIDLPGAANNRVKAIRQVFKFGMRKKHPDGKPYVFNNPARDVEKFKYGSTEFHSWTQEEVLQFEERHPPGTKARLALALLLFTGQRRADVIRFGKQHVRNGKLMFTQRKGRHRKPKQLALPILPALQRIIDASPCGDLTFLVNNLNRPFTDAGFGNNSATGAIKRAFRTARPMACVRRARPSQRTMGPRRGSLWRSSVGIASRWRTIHAGRQSRTTCRERDVSARH